MEAFRLDKAAEYRQQAVIDPAPIVLAHAA